MTLFWEKKSCFFFKREVKPQNIYDRVSKVLHLIKLEKLNSIEITITLICNCRNILSHSLLKGNHGVVFMNRLGIQKMQERK